MTLASTKRILAVLLLLCMVFGLLPASAFADGDAAKEPVLEEAADAVAEEDFEPVGEIADLQAEAAMIGADILPQAATTFTLYLDKNCSNSPTVSSKTYNITAGTTVNLSKYYIDRPPVDINKDGSYYEHYEIISWNTATNGTGESYERGGSFVMPESDVTLYAIWEVTEQKHWEVIIEGNGTLTHHPFVHTPNSDDYITVNPGDSFNIYAQDNGSFWNGTLQTITPIPAAGYVFEGWYMYGDTKLDVTELGRATLQNYTLTSDILAAGRNKIVAKFVENDGSWASVKYQQAENGYVYYEQMVKKGTATPTVSNPTYNNHYFLGWEPEVSATVTDDVVYTAKWLEGPTSANTADALYTIHCISGNGVNGAHADMSGSFTYCTSNNDISYDSASGVYKCSVTVDRIGTALGVGPGCYDVYSGQEHFAVESAPVVNLVWDASANQWKPDGEQIVEVTHASGDEAIDDADLLAKLTKIICVTDSDDPSNYTSLNLLKGSYNIVYTQTTGNTRTAEVHITNLNAYVTASKLGLLYEIDWENNLHAEDYYVFYMTRSLTTKSIANGTTYAAWSNWNYDKISTEFQSTGDVKHNEATYGKELLVKIPKFTVTFTDGEANGAAFGSKVFDVFPFDGVADLPYWDVEDPDEWAINNVLRFNPEEYQLPTGEYFIEWSPELPAPNTGVTEDLVFEAQWDKRVFVSYYDGCSAPELPWGECIMDFDYFFPKYDEFPEILDDDGNAFVPERDDFLFSGWKAVQDPEASESYLDGNTGYLVNVYREEGDDEAPIEYAIILVAQWVGDEEYVEAEYASLKLDGTIGVNFEMRIPASLIESENTRAVFIYKGVETSIDFHSMEHDGNNSFVFTYRVPAREFANPIGLKFVDGDTIIPMFYSNGTAVEDNILIYSAEKYTHSSYLKPEGRALAQAVQNYCAYAYQYLPKADNQEPQVFDTPDVSTVTASMLDPYKLNISGQVTGLTITSYYLSLLSSTNVNLELSLAEGHTIGEYTFTLDGNSITPSLTDGSYVLVISNISARGLDTPHELVITHGTESYSVTLFGLSFARTVLNSSRYDSNTELRNLCKAIYLYNAAANAYFGD